MATKLGTLTLDLVARIGSFTQGMRQASTTAEREMGRVQNSVVTVDGLIKKLAVTAGAVFSVGQIISYTDKYTGLQNKLKLVTNSQSELNTAMSDTFSIAQNTGSAWDSTAMVYQRFADNAKRLGITMAETASLTETVSKAISISGGSAASAEAALMQFGQALASGVLRGEEFNSISEQAPGLLKAIAKGMGVNIGELRAMAGEGKITGDVLVDSLSKAKPYIDDLFNKTDFTIGNSVTQLSNAVTQFVGEAGKGSGAAKLLSTSISTLANNLEPIANAGAAVAIGLLAKAMIGGVAATTNATYSLIAKADASIAERQANIASTQAELASATAEARSTQITLTNAKATHVQIMAEIELEQVRLKAQITAQGRMATITRMAQLGRLQAQVALEIAAAETAQASASARLITAQTALTAATTRLAIAKAALMSIFSPMGIAIAATAATFYFLSDSSDEVKESLATQAESVESLTKKYLELNSVQALTEGLRLRKEIEQQNDVIDDASSSMERYAYFQKEMFRLSGSDHEDYKKAITAIKTGASDAGDLLKEMIKSGRFSQPQIDKMIEFSAAVADSKKEIAQKNTALKILSATSSEHTKVTEESLKQLGVQANLVKVATQNFAGMKVQMLETLQAQVELSRLNGASEESITSLNSIISKYSLNQLSASDAVSQFNKVAKIPKDVVQGIQDYAVKTDGAKDSVNKAVIAQKTLAVATGQAKNEIKEQAKEVAGLNAELKKLLSSNAESTTKSNYLTEMVKRNVDPKFAEMLYEARKNAGLLGTGKTLGEEILKSVLDRWKADQGLNKTLEERAKIEERNKKFIEAQGTAMKVNAEVAKAAAKHNFASIEAKNNLPKGLISATIMQESKGSIYNSKGGVLTSASGAKGPAQFMPDTAKRFNVDVTSMKSSAEGVAKYYVRLLDLFDGDLNKAISAYHAGEGNVQRGTNIGPINRQYVKNIKGYMAGASGVSFDEDYSSEDWLKEQEQFAIEREKREKEMAAKQKEISLNIASEEVRIRSKLADDLNDIKDSGFDDAETKRLIAEYQKRSDIDIQIVQASHNDKLSTYSDYLKTEETLTNESFARRQRDLKLDIDFSSKGYIEASLNLEKQRVQEIERLKRTQKLDVLEAKRDWMDKGEYAREYYALIREEILNTASYSPEMKDALIQQASAQQNTEQAGEGDSAISDYKDVMGYEDSPLIKQFEVLDKMRKLDLISEEKYQQDKLQLQAISTASYMEGMFSGFASMVDENSKTYAVLFAAQKAFAVAQAMLNIPAAYSKAYDAVVGTPYIGPYIAPAVGAAAAALQVAQAASIKGVGFADGGFTGYGGKYEVGGVVHKGEGVLTQEEIAALGGPAGFYALRESIKNGFADGGLVLDAPKVLNPNQNKDLTNYLSQAQSNSSKPQPIENNLRVIMVKDEDEAKNWLYNADGEKAFLYHYKRNKSKL